MIFRWSRDPDAVCVEHFEPSDFVLQKQSECSVIGMSVKGLFRLALRRLGWIMLDRDIGQRLLEFFIQRSLFQPKCKGINTDKLNSKCTGLGVYSLGYKYPFLVNADDLDLQYS